MRVIIVSNRLPVTRNASEDGIEVKPSIGGLAKGLDAFLNHYKTTTEAEYLWVGWAGVNLSQYSQTDIHNYLHQLNCFPIEIPDETMEKFYTGFCNKTIWPLFHYLAAYFSYDEDDWQVYKQINQAFCDTIAAIIKPNDIVWIQDYHLLLLPECLRNKAPNIVIGLFLHIPFPSFEIFQFLPQQCRTEILDGMLGADLIGFHTHEYSQHFTKCVVRMVGYEYNIEHITTNDHLVKVEVYPMGIDFYQIQKLLDKKSVAKQQNSILQNIRGEKIILSLDRLDYTKGVANRLYAYEKFLSDNPKWYKKVVLILIVAPSREQVSHYATIKRQIDELIG
ncbi:MAG: trehalose-6-phosphate synthase, partial [Burkholderiales bacterium]